VVAQLKEKNIELQITDEAKLFVANSGFDADFGARPLRRAIQRLIENPLAEYILQGKYQSGSTVHISVQDNELVFD